MLATELERSAPKAAGSFDRCVPLTETLAHVPGLCSRFGIARLADLTYLDRALVPVFSAVVPRSPDVISTYNGKGTTREHALAGAVMEAVERQCATRPQLARVAPSQGSNVVDPATLGVRAGAELAFVRGYDALARVETFVPLVAVQFPAEERLGVASTTSGLASGNTLLEAAYHGLSELVERHLFSLAHARGHVRPTAFLAAFCGAAPNATFAGMVDDPAGRSLELPTGDASLDAYCARIFGAGLTSRVVVVEEPGLPLLVTAVVAEDGARTRAHMGLGCSWSPVHAIGRALSEAMQGRLTDTSGAREDIVRENAPPGRPHDEIRRRSHLPHGRWYFDAPCERVVLGALVDRSSCDLRADFERLVDAVAVAGATHVAVVDLTPPECPVRVVRVVAPGLETAFVDGRIGRTIEALLAQVRPPQLLVTPR